MNLNSRLNVVHVVCEEAHRYTDGMRGSLLVGLYELADSCLEYLAEVDPEKSYSKSHDELEVMKNICERALQTGDFSGAFRSVALASQKARNIPGDI